MSFARYDLLTSPPSPRRSLWLAALLVAGCASAPEPQGPDPRDEALRLAEARYTTDMAEAQRTIGQLKDDLTQTGRELQRLQAALSAARNSRAALEVSLDGALARLKNQDEQLALLRGQAPASQTADEAHTLLIAQKRQIDALRAALVEARTGEPAPSDPALEGIVTPSSLELQRPVARLDDEPISRREFVEFLYRDLAAPQLLELYLNRRLILREARRRGLEVSDVDTEVWVSEQILAQTQSSGGEEQLRQKLAERGYTREAWTARLRYQARPALLLTKLVEMERDGRSGRDLFEQRLQALYLTEFGERAAARHILVRVGEGDGAAGEEQAALDKARAIKAQIDRGAPFEELAARWSEDADSARTGGVLGTFDRARFAASARLNTALFTLPVGTVSEPIRSRLGYHLLLVDRRDPPVRPFDAQLRRELSERLRREPPSEEEVGALLTSLRSRARIETSLEFD